MKKVCAIICEYDPFHNGHKYQIQLAKTLSGCEFVMCLMSGSFVQRGYPSIIDKHTRTIQALSNGADMVLLLPAIYATSSAQTFAQGAIKMLTNIPFVTHLCFGIEQLDFDFIKLLKNFDFKLIKNKSKNLSTLGLSSPKTYQEAIKAHYGDNVASAFNNPNFILGFEYMQAIDFYKSSIIPVPITRTNNYNDNNLTTPFASSTAIRQAIINNNDISNYIPYDSNELPNNVNFELYKSILSLVVKNIEIDKLQQINGITEGLHYRIKSKSHKTSNYDTIINTTKTKRYLHSRLRRIMLQTYLGITKNIISTNINTNALPFFKILGIKTHAIELLGYMPHNKIIKHSDIDSLDDNAKSVLNIEFLADNLYSSLINYKGNLFDNPLIKI